MPTFDSQVPPPGNNRDLLDAITPARFHDRRHQQDLIKEFLDHESFRLLNVHGRRLSGKTQTVKHVLKYGRDRNRNAWFFSLKGDSPDPGTETISTGSCAISCQNLLSELIRILEVGENPTTDPLRERVQSNPVGWAPMVLEDLANRNVRVVVLLDEFNEPLLSDDAPTNLALTIKAILECERDHGVRIIITSKSKLKEFNNARLAVDTAKWTDFDMEREDWDFDMDARRALIKSVWKEQKVDLTKIKDEEFDRVCKIDARGRPGLLWSLARNLVTRKELNRFLKLNELPDDTLNYVAGLSYDRLKPAQRRVVQAVAVFDTAAPKDALQAMLTGSLEACGGSDFESVFDGLLNENLLVQEESGRYRLKEETFLRDFTRRKMSRSELRDLQNKALNYFHEHRADDASVRDLNDLLKPFDEINIRCAAGQFVEAAKLFCELGGRFLLNWGEFDLLLKHHLTFIEKVDDKAVRQQCLGQLGIVYLRKGEFRKAKEKFNGAFEVASKMIEMQSNGWQQATLDAARWQMNLGTVAAELGDLETSLANYRSALAQSIEVDRQDMDAKIHICISNRLAELGRTDEASRELIRAESVASPVGSEDIKRYVLFNRLELLIDKACDKDCISGIPLEPLNEIEQLVNPLRNTRHRQLKSGGAYSLGLARLLAKEYIPALEIVEACRSDPHVKPDPEWTHHLLLLEGLIHWHLGERRSARSSFEAAQADADARLQASANVLADDEDDRNYRSLDVKGLALCGLALCDFLDDAGGFHNLLAEAEQTIVDARAKCDAPGVVQRIKCLIGQLETPPNVVSLLGPVKEILDSCLPVDPPRPPEVPEGGRGPEQTNALEPARNDRHLSWNDHRETKPRVPRQYSDEVKVEPVDGMLKILFLAANPNKMNGLRLDEEFRSIQNCIRPFRDRIELLNRQAVRDEDLAQALMEVKPHVVHFSGHGNDRDELILQDDRGNPQPVSRDAIVKLFKTLRDDIRLVVFNACFSEPLAEGVVENIAFAIGMNQEIGDEAAIQFAEALYRAICYGRTLREAFDLGRIDLELAGIAEDLTPQLLAHPKANPAETCLIRAKEKRSKRRKVENTRMSIYSGAIALWKEKLAALLEAEPLEDDPTRKLRLKKQIEECNRKVQELTENS